MKTLVKLIQKNKDGKFQAGDVGYIDGYIQMADGIGYAVVVVGNRIEPCHLTILSVIVNKEGE